MHDPCLIEKTCRVCGSGDLSPVLDLGRQPLANAYLESATREAPAFPLTLCHCGQCGLVQIRETVTREGLFDQYVWITGTSSSARTFSKKFCEQSVELAALPKNALVVEVASNDGTFLKPFADRGMRVLGIDPAHNLAEMARGQGLEVWDRYWEETTAEDLVREKGTVDFIFGRNVVAHVSALHSFIRGMGAVLKDGGSGALEFHWSATILEGLQYDSIYHEHLCYFSLSSISTLLAKYGLNVFEARESPISGGALIVYFTKDVRQPAPSVARVAAIEKRLQLGERVTWQQFGRQCQEHARQTKEVLMANRGKKMIGYGSSARSNTFLNFLGLDSSLVSSIIDNNPAKHGRYTPGARILIVSEAAGFAAKPEAIFALAWNFNEEIKRACMQASFTGNYITAFPGQPRIEKIT